MRYSIACVGDTQYLFDGGRTRPDLLALAFEELDSLQRSGAIGEIRHVVHVGDVTEHGWETECGMAAATFAGGHALLGVGFTIVAGNHDVEHHSDDTRGKTPFLATFGPDSPLAQGRFVGRVEYDAMGYSSWRSVELPDGTSLGVLGLDWRCSESTLTWADSVLAARTVPTVVVTHDVAADGALTANGERIAALMETHSHVWLVAGGHEWPSTRVVRGAEYHAVNYQQLPFGGAGAMRVYDVDTERGECQVISLCPALRHPDVLRSPDARRQLALAREEDQFVFPLRSNDVPWQASGMSLLAEQTRPGEYDVALPERWCIAVEATLPVEFASSWQVLLARLGKAPAGSDEPLAALSLSTENFASWMAYTELGETWVNTHEIAPGARVRIVVTNAHAPGLWVDSNPAGRVDAHTQEPLAEGPYLWRVGGGEYAGQPADPFLGQIHRVRWWG